MEAAGRCSRRRRDRLLSLLAHHTKTCILGLDRCRTSRSSGSAARGVTFESSQRSHGGWLVSSCGASSRAWIQRPMQAVGPGVREIRIHIALARRVFYVATRPEAIYVLHAFEKKTQKTSAHDLRIGRDRFRGLGKLRQQHGKEKRG